MNDTQESTSGNLGYGWLAQDENAPNTLESVIFDGEPPTRRQEYGWAHQQLKALPPGLLMDAGTGYNTNIHVFPFIAANMGWLVEALDADLRQFALSYHPGVRRTFSNIGATPFKDHVFDAITCISTLEHMSDTNRNYFRMEAFRLLKPGGTLLITTDETDPEAVAEWFRSISFDVGERQPDPDEHLNPKVAYLAARKS